MLRAIEIGLKLQNKEIMKLKITHSKIISLILVLTICLSILTSCRKSNSDNVSSDNSSLNSYQNKSSSETLPNNDSSTGNQISVTNSILEENNQNTYTNYPSYDYPQETFTSEESKTLSVASNPENQFKIQTVQLPKSVSWGSEGMIVTAQINKIEYELDDIYEDSCILYITLIGEVTHVDEKNYGCMPVQYQVLDEDGFVIEQKTVNVGSAEVGLKFKNRFYLGDRIKAGTYTINVIDDI